MTISTDFDEANPHNLGEKPLSGWPKFFSHLGILPVDDKPLRTSQLRECYERPESFANFLPWVSYSKEREVFIFQDGISAGVVFELQAADGEARPLPQLLKMLDQLNNAFTHVPERSENPWIAQFYVKDEPLMAMGTVLRNYAGKINAPDTPLLHDYLDMQEKHFKQMGTEGGVFEDRAAGVRWGGKYRRIRMCFYRHFDHEKWPNESGAMPGDELNRVIQSVLAGLTTMGMKYQRYGPAQLYQWMFAWFNPQAVWIYGLAVGVFIKAPCQR